MPIGCYSRVILCDFVYFCAEALSLKTMHAGVERTTWSYYNYTRLWSVLKNREPFLRALAGSRVVFPPHL